MVRIFSAALGAVGVALAVTAVVAPARALDQVTFGTDWQAEAEHGGYYQALATGLYEKYGLKVTLRQGGPQVNQTQLLAAGRLDFEEAPASFTAMNFAKEKIPMVAVAAFFQKDPSVLIAHPGVGNDSLQALKGKPIMIGADTRVGWWLFLKAKFGYADNQIRPYNFNMTPFLADKNAVQQGYLTSEPFLIEQQGKVKPVVFLLADEGYTSYGSIIEVSQKTIDGKPDLVQRFVNASIEGWYSFLYGDPAPAYALIKKDNPDQSDDLLKYAHDTMKAQSVVDSGDSLKLGIGAMSDARWQDFFKVMSDEGLYPKDMDWKKGYTLRFVDQHVGMSSPSK
ncbi:MAG TPA: ABC transporter substrate-binding protein [Stellaceae bacterium]|jgi:NitT/TauT family transport system substrate-binding protein|nr:ABC transporter substrate-binding protein [Stellaceae bacterium]